MREDAAPFESHADDLARLRGSVNDLGGRTALERVVQRLSELVADNEALRKQLTERGSAQEARPGIESQSSLIVNSIPGLVATLTPAGEVELVNDQVLRVLRWHAEGDETVGDERHRSSRRSGSRRRRHRPIDDVRRCLRDYRAPSTFRWHLPVVPGPRASVS